MIDPASGDVRQRLNFDADLAPRLGWLDDGVVVDAGGKLVCLRASQR